MAKKTSPKIDAYSIARDVCKEQDALVFTLYKEISQGSHKEQAIIKYVRLGDTWHLNGLLAPNAHSASDFYNAGEALNTIQGASAFSTLGYWTRCTPTILLGILDTFGAARIARHPITFRLYAFNSPELTLPTYRAKVDEYRPIGAYVHAVSEQDARRQILANMAEWVSIASSDKVRLEYAEWLTLGMPIQEYTPNDTDIPNVTLDAPSLIAL